MTTKNPVGLELPRILPGNPAWIRYAAYLSEVLGLAAAAARVRPDEYPLPALALETAGEVIEEIAAALTTAAADTAPPVVLYVLPAWTLKALRDVLAALHAAAVEEPGGDGLRSTLVLLGESLDYPRVRTPAEMAADLDAVVAVLALDGPAVRAAATDLALSRCRADTGTALTEVYAHWVRLGVPL
ncbi:hypothetical protein [Streptomyces sp. CBMA156]|uniref:hypothetical protein n=1 Tax=Streptomyces sp. CBMA156 TaxID=1930280 RepID=UPI001661B06B|nr:hypothetical protein [Streptomyces sp. CBMA156]MBD0675483.1 hypothetical protein [Streptomyces sp. CBMA156]